MMKGAKLIIMVKVKLFFPTNKKLTANLCTILMYRRLKKYEKENQRKLKMIFFSKMGTKKKVETYNFNTKTEE